MLQQTQCIAIVGVDREEDAVILTLAQLVDPRISFPAGDVDLGKLLQTDLDLVADQRVPDNEKDFHELGFSPYGEAACAPGVFSTPAERRLNYLAGVDEAGLGPILGPLVVAGCAMAGPAGVDPWAALSDKVCRDRREKGKIRVADSKKVNQGTKGLQHLEQTALGFWGAWRGELPPTFPDLLDDLGVPTGTLRECPWYGDLDLTLPLVADRDLLELQAHGLGRALRREGLEIIHLAALPVDAKEFNELIRATNNKSRAHFHAYSRVIAEVVALLPNGAHLVADRCGGLTHYTPALKRAYPKATIRTLVERQHESSYAVSRGDRDVKISFAAGGEDRAFPTALASCLAKYLRELMLHLLNRWFCERMPGLRPTAGYYTDGHRFLDDIAPMLATGEFPREILVRSR